MNIELIKEADNYRIYWYDVEKTIIVLEITRKWTWDEAVDALVFTNKIVAENQDRPMFPVLHFNPGLSMIPEGFSLEKLRQLIKMNTPSEKLVLISSEENTVLRMIVTTVTRLYGLNHIFEKYRFTDTFEEALQLIADYKSQHNL